MIIAVSIEKGFDDYSEISKLSNIPKTYLQFSEFAGFKHPLLETFRKEFGYSIQYFEINWKDILGVPKSLIKENKFGKYNINAPAVAAKNLIDYATHYIEFGRGDYNISQAIKGKPDIIKISFTDSKETDKKGQKRYNF